MGAMAFVPCPSCRFLISPTDTTCRWCKADLEEVRAAKNRLKPPPAGAHPVDFVPKKGLLRRGHKPPKAPKPAKAAKKNRPDIDVEALKPKKPSPIPPPPVSVPVPVQERVPERVAVAAHASAPVLTAAPPVLVPAAPVHEMDLVEAPVFARLAAPHYVVAPTPPPPVVAHLAPAPAAPPPPPVLAPAAEPVTGTVTEPEAEPVAKAVKAPKTPKAPKAPKAEKAPREPRPVEPGKGTWRYTTATLVTLGVIAASMATASYVVNRPTGVTATTVATTVVPTTAGPIIPSAWLNYAAPDGSFTVDMPVTPTVTTAASADDPSISETTYDAIAGGTALKVTGYPHAIDQTQVHDLLQSFKNSALTVEGSSLASEQETTIGGRPALAYTVAQTDTTLYFTEIFDTDRVYTLVSALGTGDTTRFVSSLVIAPHVPN